MSQKPSEIQLLWQLHVELERQLLSQQHGLFWTKVAVLDIGTMRGALWMSVAGAKVCGVHT